MVLLWLLVLVLLLSLLLLLILLLILKHSHVTITRPPRSIPANLMPHTLCDATLVLGCIDLLLRLCCPYGCTWGSTSIWDEICNEYMDCCVSGSHTRNTCGKPVNTTAVWPIHYSMSKPVQEAPHDHSTPYTWCWRRNESTSTIPSVAYPHASSSVAGEEHDGAIHWIGPTWHAIFLCVYEVKFHMSTIDSAAPVKSEAPSLAKPKAVSDVWCQWSAKWCESVATG